MVGEIKKQKYIYYHCTGYVEKCRGEPASCRRKYVLKEGLEWVRAALHAMHADERHEHQEAIKWLQAEHRRLGKRIDAM